LTVSVCTNFPPVWTLLAFTLCSIWQAEQSRHPSCQPSPFRNRALEKWVIADSPVNVFFLFLMGATVPPGHTLQAPVLAAWDSFQSSLCSFGADRAQICDELLFCWDPHWHPFLSMCKAFPYHIKWLGSHSIVFIPSLKLWKWWMLLHSEFNMSFFIHVSFKGGHPWAELTLWWAHLILTDKKGPNHCFVFGKILSFFLSYFNFSTAVRGRQPADILISTLQEKKSRTRGFQWICSMSEKLWGVKLVSVICSSKPQSFCLLSLIFHVF
jgi:hypothetical protein